MSREPGLFLRGAPSGVAVDFRRTRSVAVTSRDGKLQHPRHASFAKDWIAEDLVVHVPSLRDEAGILDIANDLDFVHAVRGTGSADDVLFDHDAAHVVR